MLEVLMSSFFSTFVTIYKSRRKNVENNRARLGPECGMAFWREMIFEEIFLI